MGLINFIKDLRSVINTNNVDSDSVVFTTDTHQIYVGNELYTGYVREVEEGETVSDPAEGILYIFPNYVFKTYSATTGWKELSVTLDEEELYTYLRSVIGRAINVDTSGIENSLDGIEDKVDSVKSVVDGIDTNMATSSEITPIATNVSSIKSTVESTSTNVSDIKSTLTTHNTNTISKLDTIITNTSSSSSPVTTSAWNDLVTKVNIIYKNCSTFSTDSWASINEVCKAGLASVYYNLGDIKIVSINGTDYRFAIVDFNHDELTSTNSEYNSGSLYAGITLGMVGNYSEKYKQRSSNSSSSIGGIWGIWYGTSNGFPTRYACDTTIYNYLLSSIGSGIIKQVKKKLYDTNSTAASSVSTTNDYVFIPSMTELGYTTLDNRTGDGTPYAYSLQKSVRDATLSRTPLYTTQTSDYYPFAYVYYSNSHSTVSNNNSYLIQPYFCV